MEETITDQNTGEETVRLVNVPQTALQQLKAVVKIDVTPKGVYDKYAQELSIENMLNNGLFHPQRMGELKIYYKILPDDSVAPKMAIGEALEYMEAEQRKIALYDAQAQMMMQRASGFIMGDPDTQAQQMADAQMQLMAQQEQQYAQQEAELDQQVPEEATVE
jgi:hypothetical protein